MKTMEMDCREAIQDFRLYVDGELDQSEAGALQEHLAGCPDCQAELQRRQAMYSFLSTSYGDKRISGGFAQTAEGRLMEEPEEGYEDEEAFSEFEEEEEKRRPAFVATLLGSLGALPWWIVSGMFHGLVITAAVLIGMALIPHKVKHEVIITDMAKEKKPEVDRHKQVNPFKEPKEVKEISDIQLPMVTAEETEVDFAVETDAEIEDASEFGFQDGDEGNGSGEGLTGEAMGLGAGLGARLGNGGVPIGGGRKGMIGKIGNVSFAGQRLALVFDNSLSMKAVVEFAKEAIIEFLGQAKGKGTIDFYCEINQKQAHELHKLQRVPLRTSKDEIVKWFEGMPGGGYDKIGEAASSVWWGFEAAMQEYPDMVIFVTDWKLHSPNKEYNWRKQTMEIERVMNDLPSRKPRLVFFTPTTDGAQRQAMEKLAEESKGEVHTVSKKKKKKKK